MRPTDVMSELLTTSGALLVLTAVSPGVVPTEPVPTEPLRVDSGERSGPWDLVLTDVRAGHRDDVDRVVLEFDGDGVPGWRVEYVDRAVLDGSGTRVRLQGESILQIGVLGTEWPGPDHPRYYDGPDRLPAAGAGVLTEVFAGGTFEGSTQVFAGLEGDPAALDVLVLDEPARLVIDVRDARPAS